MCVHVHENYKFVLHSLMSTYLVQVFGYIIAALLLTHSKVRVLLSS